MRVQTVHRYRFDQLSRYLAVCGVLAPVAIISFVLMGASVTPGYSHITDTISKLASPGAPHPEWMNAGFISYGVLMICLSFAVRRCLPQRAGNTAVWLMIVIHGVGIILAAVFPYDLSIIDGIHSVEGILHHLVSIMSCVAFIISMLIIDRIVSAEPEWRTVTRLSFLAIFVVYVLFVLSLFPVVREIEGALQRASALAMITYIEALSLRCLTLSKAFSSISNN
ncbi:MAG TPA: DUF998 domain-containing protein [Dehalococcoidia bacterium]|nr:DUF998 domain-containing protein [Dehalococcoidia bacterium]